MRKNPGIFRDAGPVILRWEANARWSRLDAGQFRRMAALVGLVAFGLLFLTWSRVRVLANGYQIAELRTQRDQLLNEHLHLERRLQEIQSLDYAEAVARHQLGMVDVNPNQVITLRKQGTASRLWEGVSALFSSKDKDGGPDKAPAAKAKQ
jgi:cell division protein FtsB